MKPHLFGELEADIMEIVWKLERASVREVLTALTKRRHVAYTTVMTVMARLYDKGILKRELHESGAYMYTPHKSKEEFLEDASKTFIEALIQECGEIAVAQFFDVLERRDPKKLNEWRRKLKSIA
jgi:predicted transcriptional regulator